MALTFPYHLATAQSPRSSKPMSCHVACTSEDKRLHAKCCTWAAGPVLKAAEHFQMSGSIL
eukprot:CAMPEP_0198555412 /NCGR_PEP_ID=MMETSP1462-20131121/84672_1 /TAXON_ID=1333877 /ORGANISM="Brandtodinium nutriculum, Strain RCC3387" /LENGTH=60 /DNA_ID=CAMNT_0044286137 /DNA_START=56 /DNA_END=235 /DNA_ORIENTATION=-